MINNPEMPGIPKMVPFGNLDVKDTFQMMDFLNKYFSLLFKALTDIIGFMILFMWLILYFCLVFSVIGGTFDDGGNFDLNEDEFGDSAYDTLHNDYPNIGQAWENIK